MRDPTLGKAEIKRNVSTIGQRNKNISCLFDEFLLIKLRNLVSQQKFAPDPKFYSVNDLVRQALINYKEQKLKIDSSLRKLGNPRITYNFTLTPELYDFYKTWPSRQKVGKLETIIIAYLNKIQ